MLNPVDDGVPGFRGMYPAFLTACTDREGRRRQGFSKLSRFHRQGSVYNPPPPGLYLPSPVLGAAMGVGAGHPQVPHYSPFMSSTDSSSVIRPYSPKLVLASASRIRLSLLRNAAIPVIARPAAIDEETIKCTARRGGAGPGETALLLALRKAERIARPGALVIGADQILVCGGAWFDKPVDLTAARAHLLALRGRSHVLHTAVTLLRDGRVVWRHVATPRLTMRAFSDAALDAYLALEGERVLTSVGAYRLEGPGIQLFDSVEGEHAAMLGLPMLPLLNALREQGVLS